MTNIFQIILRNERNENDYIVLENYKTMEQAEKMLEWYENHHRFFKGEFSIRNASC